MVADVVIEIAAAPRGEKPYRASADPAGDGSKETATVLDKFGEDFYCRIGLEKLLKVTLQ